MSSAPATRPTGRSARFGLLAVCLFGSGAAGLIYEVVWVRLFSEVMGHTVYALSAVLTSFLGGLALGAYVAGQWTRRHTVTVRVYAVLEVAIAAFALAMPWAIDACSPVFAAAYRSYGDSFVLYNLVQFLVCGSSLLLPTALMGMTLPVVTALLLSGSSDIARGAGRLYGANTMGAAAGAAAAGFWLLPSLGMAGTALLAACVNVLVAVIAMYAGMSAARGRGRAELGSANSHTRSLGSANGQWRAGGHDAHDGAPSERRRTAKAPAGRSGRSARSARIALRPPPSDWPAPSYRPLLWLYGLSGFASLTLEVAWARMVSLSIGSTTYGFTVILVTFVAGLGLGSMIGGRLVVMVRRPVIAVCLLNVAIALWSLLSLSYLGSLPIRVIQLMGALGLGFRNLLAGELALVASTILWPTLCMGAMFPLVAQLVYRTVGESGGAVGTGYAANTWGNILGSFIAGFALIPLIGMRNTIIVSGLISSAVAAAYMIPDARRRRGWGIARGVILVAMTLTAAASTPAWNHEIVTSGPYFYGNEVLGVVGDERDPRQIQRAIEAAFELVDYREGATTVASVRRQGTMLFLQAGGYIEAGSYAPTQQLIAHLPLLLHGAAKDVLVVGLGTGVTLGSVLTHPVETADCVEISAEVRDMAREYFADLTGHALDDRRANVIIGDGRNHLRNCGKKYDVIVSQPSVPWMSGAASLFTHECFTDMRKRLRPNGLACAWYQPWDPEMRDTRSLLRTWSDVFPRCYVFESPSLGEYMLIGVRDAESSSPSQDMGKEAPAHREGAAVRFSAATVNKGLAMPPVAEDLKPLNIADASDLLGELLFGPGAVAAYSAGARLNTDDNAYIEFTTPAGIFSREKLKQHADLHRFRELPTRYIDVTLDDDAATATLAKRLERIHASKELILSARRIDGIKEDYAQWRELMVRAAQLNPRDPYVIRRRRAWQGDSGS